MESIEKQIERLDWLNHEHDHGESIDPYARTKALLEALNEIAEQLANINQVLNNRP